MIIKALYDYFNRCEGLAPEGLEYKEIPFVVVIDHEGHFVRLEDMRELVGKSLRAKRFCVSKGIGRSGSNSYLVTYPFWDHYGYVLCQPKEDTDKAINDARKQNESFIKLIHKYCELYPDNKQFKAVRLFYSQFDDNRAKIVNSTDWLECLKIKGCNLSFRIQGEPLLVSENTAIKNEIEKSLSTSDSPQALCIISGERGEIAQIHTAINLAGAKSGAKLIGFQKSSGYDSYGKEQGYNAPISRQVEAAYTTALNSLLSKDSKNKFSIGGQTYVFWSEKPTQFEDLFSSLFAAPPKDDPNANVEQIKKLMNSVYSGIQSKGDDTHFYLLGLSPNAARVVVRTWQMGTVSQFATNIQQHFEDVSIKQSFDDDKPYYSLFNLLTQIAFDYKLENLSPQIFPAMVDAIMDNTPYPTTLQASALRRIKVDNIINRIRASVLKAYLNRKYRKDNSIKQITMALDKTNLNEGYLCGRLFAILEKLQTASAPTLNATIKERYYTSASTTPVTVFGRLLALSNHHAAKLNEGSRIYYEKLIQDVVALLPSHGFPRHLSLDDQSRFALGYYHERCELWEKRTDTKESKE